MTEDRFGGGKHSIAILDALNEAFFQDMGFRGNTANYYNPANSFIDKVLENRQGIPDLKKNITGCLIIIWTGLYIKIGIVQKVYDGLSCPFAKMILLLENHFGKMQAWSLILFERYAYFEI